MQTHEFFTAVFLCGFVLLTVLHLPVVIILYIFIKKYLTRG